MGRHSLSVSCCGILTSLFGITEMNERIQELRKQAWTLVSEEERARGELYEAREQWERCDQKFAELIVRECIDILETEIELVKGYKSTACNDFDVRWHEGKIAHFDHLIEKSKKHFGVEE
jgi:hypothetical protein